MLAAPAALASFHFMQIEQVIGGVGGDTTQQAIQLRLRGGSQNQMQFSRLVIRDAAGANPMVLVDMTAPVPNAAGLARVLIVSPAFAAAQNPNEDFVMTATIPASHLAAGRLTFEDDFGTIYWGVAWGGAGYTGANNCDFTNDANGNCGPAFAGPLPSMTGQALLYNGAAGGASGSNSTDYTVTAGDATFTNNAGASAAVNVPPPPDPPILRDGFEDPP
jgi:hypothetical protein